MRNRQESLSNSPVKKTGSRLAGARLTPGERHALLVVLGLFALGCLVRMCRSAHSASLAQQTGEHQRDAQSQRPPARPRSGVNPNR